MRALIFFFALTNSAAAWEFSPEPICTLRHDTDTAAFTITYDAATQLYSLDIVLKDGDWAHSTRFGIAYSGANPLTIGTGNHVIDGPNLTVSDSGFGNVLDGIALNDVATAFTDTQSVTIPLSGAVEPLRAFRQCPSAAPLSS